MRAAPLALWLVAAGCDRTAAEYPLGTSPDPRLGTPLYEVAGKNALAGYTWRWNTTHVPLTVEELVEDVDGNVHVVVGHGPWRQFGSLTTGLPLSTR